MAQQVRSARNTGDVGDAGSVPELGRFLGGINGNPLQYSCLKNAMNRGAWWATVHGSQKGQTGLSTAQHSPDFSTKSHTLGIPLASGKIDHVLVFN